VFRNGRLAGVGHMQWGQGDAMTAAVVRYPY
jgi:hypothetical protein